ncbi:MAG: class I SAM-dependent methyltransferase [Myxococcales bacterium]|nr:class I SAM-dependent methyltransferase [Myxococcales bacterium]
MAENRYGDDLDRAEGGFGADIASQRMDALDRAALHHALSLDGGHALDLGAGSSIQAVRFATLGLETLAVDALPRARTLVGRLDLERALPIRYLEKDARALTRGDLPARLDLVYSQRFIHHLRHGEAVALLRLVAEAMPPGARLFLSASGLASELAEGYPAGPIEARYATLSPAMQAKHHIEGPVCLYAAEELEALAEAAGFATERVELSPFGNVKGIFTRIGPPTR